MATGHLNPGYYLPVSQLERTNKLPSSYESKVLNALTPEISNRRWLTTQPNMPDDVLETIRREARQKWHMSRQNDCAALTSYLGDYQIKRLEEPTRLRPSSPTRMNNPHPSVIFLTCRLHHLPGFHSGNMRSEYSTIKDRSSEVVVHDLEDEGASHILRSSTPCKESDEDSKISVRDKLSMTTMSTSSRPPSTSPMGVIERPKTASTIKLNRSTLRSASQRSEGSMLSSQSRCLPQRPHTCITRESPFRSGRNLIYQKTLYPRGDYSIHYQWPITIQHHRLY